jgi:hypothetical protein
MLDVLPVEIFTDILTVVCHDIILSLNINVPQNSGRPVYKFPELLNNYLRLHLVCHHFHSILNQRVHIHGVPIREKLREKLIDH